jgi:hypothetical protein
MKREVDKLLRRHFSEVVGDKLKQRTLVLAELVNVFKKIIPDWVKFEHVLPCLRHKFRGSIPSICKAVTNGIPRKPHPVRDPLAHFKNDRQNQRIVRKNLNMIRVPSRKMTQQLEEMWGNLSTEHRAKYDKKAERDIERQQRDEALRKDPALHEFVLGFCSTISDRHGKCSICRLHGCYSCRVYANFDAHSLVCRRSHKTLVMRIVFTIHIDSCLLSADQQSGNAQSPDFEQLKRNLEQSIERIRLLFSTDEAHLEQVGKKRYIC